MTNSNARPAARHHLGQRRSPRLREGGEADLSREAADRSAGEAAVRDDARSGVDSGGEDPQWGPDRERGSAAPLRSRAHVAATVRVERHNGVLRDRLACLTRKTHAFTKRDQSWAALV